MSTTIRDIWIRDIQMASKADALKPRPLFWRGWNSNLHQIDSGGVMRGQPAAIWKDGFEKSGHYEVALHRAEKRGEKGFVLEKVWNSAYPYSAVGHWERFISEEEGYAILAESKVKEGFVGATEPLFSRCRQWRYGDVGGK